VCQVVQSNLKIPRGKYTLDSLIEYLVDNPDKVFDSKSERKWLKSHLLYTTKDWQSLFKSQNLEQMGDIWHFSMTDEEDRTVNYVAYQWAEGLLMCLTTSTEEDYENTLLKFIKNHRGISEAWIKPDVFEKMKDFFVSKYSAVIYHFISKRSRYSNAPVRVVRPEYNRRINYSGEDAEQVLKETQVLYGTLPTTIDFRIEEDKIQLNRNGLSVIRNINRKTTRMLLEVIERIIAEELTILQTSEKFRTTTTRIGIGDNQLIIPTLVAGKITLPNSKFDERKVKMLFGEQRNEVALGKGEEEAEDLDFSSSFSFIDTYVSADATSFSATVIDETKGSIFGMSGDYSEIVLVPKHRTTFESFVGFYEKIIENFDGTAYLTTFSDESVR
jgi:hypothetical protein